MNALRNLLAMQYLPPQQQMPVNMLQLAAADEGFDPNGIVAQMLAAQRAAAAQAPQQPKPAPRQPQQQGYESATDVIRRRMREQELE